MKKQPEVTAITRENFVTAFWSLYCKKRIEQISVKEITNIAGYNRSTFYEYFTDVYDVLNYLEDIILNHMKETIVKNFDSLDNSDVLQIVAEMYDSKGEYLSVLLSEKGDPFFLKKVKTVMKPILHSILPGKESNVRVDYIFEFVMSAIFGTITYWYQQEKSISSNELLPMIRSMLTKGALQEIQKL
jgi:AcrR family transcriptional regulator